MAVILASRRSRSPKASPKLVFIPVKWHRRTDGRNDVARISRQRVLAVAGILMRKSSLWGRVLPSWPSVAPFAVIGREAGPRLLHHAATAAPRAGGPGAPTSPHAWDSCTAILRCISLLFYPLGNLQTQQIDLGTRIHTVIEESTNNLFKAFTLQSQVKPNDGGSNLSYSLSNGCLLCQHRRRSPTAINRSGQKYFLDYVDGSTFSLVLSNGKHCIIQILEMWRLKTVIILAKPGSKVIFGDELGSTDTDCSLPLSCLNNGHC